LFVIVVHLGRPKKENTAFVKDIRKLKQQVKVARVKINEGDIGEVLLRAIRDEGVFTQTNANGQEELTLAAEIRTFILHVECGVSMEKMPLCMATFLSMLTGDSLSKEVFNSLVKSSRTYDLALQKGAEALRDHVYHRMALDEVISMCLMVDDSNRDSREWTMKPVLLNIENKKIEQLGFPASTNNTKKGEESARHNLHLLLDQIPVEILYKLMSMVVDAFGKTEARGIMQKLDDKIASLPAESRAKMCRASVVVRIYLMTYQWYCFSSDFHLITCIFMFCSTLDVSSITLESSAS
jgi:hypothetical protein